VCDIRKAYRFNWTMPCFPLISFSILPHCTTNEWDRRGIIFRKMHTATQRFNWKEQLAARLIFFLNLKKKAQLTNWMHSFLLHLVSRKQSGRFIQSRRLSECKHKWWLTKSPCIHDFFLFYTKIESCKSLTRSLTTVVSIIKDCEFLQQHMFLY